MRTLAFLIAVTLAGCASLCQTVPIPVLCGSTTTTTVPMPPETTTTLGPVL